MTNNNIVDMLNSAKSTYEYVKITMNTKEYIGVYFSRNHKVHVFTNSRNYQLYKEIQVFENFYTQLRLADFIFRWVKTLNK